MVKNYIALDIETTGTSPEKNKIIEIGAVKVIDGKEKETFSKLINPECSIPYFITGITGIDNSMVKGSPTIETVMPEFIDFCEEYPILGHNLRFDHSFLSVNAQRINMKFSGNGIDTLKIAKKCIKDVECRKLDYLCKYYNIEDKNHHRALNDAVAASRLYMKMWELYGAENEKIFGCEQFSYKLKKESPITPRQKTYLMDLLKYHRINFEEDIEKLSKSEASRHIDNILSTYGRIR